MGLDVDVPDPPQLSNRGLPPELESVETVGGAGNLRREELEGILESGAWHEAFQEWAEYTDLTEDEFRLVRELGLIERLDIFWDPAEAQLRFVPLDLPDDWSERADVADVDALRSKLEIELANLGQTVVEMLEDGYVDWDSEETDDLVWSEETFGHGTAE